MNKLKIQYFKEYFRLLEKIKLYSVLYLVNINGMTHLIHTLITYFDILWMARDNLLFTVVAVYSKS